MPRSSRSHSTQLPADIMIASIPQVSLPLRLHATIGKVPPGPRRGKPGRSSPTHRSSIAPVPKVALARPGRTQPWPTSEACWSPASPRWAERPAGRWPLRTRRWSPLGGRTPCGMRKHLEHRSSSHSAALPSRRPVTARLVRSETCTPPRESVQATQESTVPAHRSRDRSGSAMSSSTASFVALWFGARRMPCACRARQNPTVRRSCHPIPGPTGSPVARSHDTVEARWLLIPTASTGPASGQGRGRHLEYGPGDLGRVELHETL